MVAVLCASCNGMGRKPGESFRVCGECIGAGETYQDSPTEFAIERWLHIDYRGRIIREYATRAEAMLSCGKLWRHCGDKVRRATLTYRV